MSSINNFPVKYKLINYKIISINYHNDHTTKNPLFYKKIARTNQPSFPVYDYVMSTTLIELNEPLPSTHTHVSTTEGAVDGYIIQPPAFFQPTPDPGINNNEKRLEITIYNPPEIILSSTEFYNSFKNRENQWYGVRAVKDTQTIVLNVDFSSLVTNKAQFDCLFKQFPYGIMSEYDPDGKLITKPLHHITQTGGIFSILQNDVKKNSVIKILWKFNWDFIYKNNEKQFDSVTSTSANNDKENPITRPNANVPPYQIVYGNVTNIKGHNVNIGSGSINITHHQLDGVSETYSKSIQNFIKELNKQFKKENVSAEDTKFIQDDLNNFVKEIHGLKEEEKIDTIKKEDIKSKLGHLAKKILTVLPKTTATIATFTPLAPFSGLIEEGVEHLVKVIQKEI